MPSAAETPSDQPIDDSTKPSVTVTCNREHLNDHVGQILLLALVAAIFGFVLHSVISTPDSTPGFNLEENVEDDLLKIKVDDCPASLLQVPEDAYDDLDRVGTATAFSSGGEAQSLTIMFRTSSIAEDLTHEELGVIVKSYVRLNAGLICQ